VLLVQVSHELQSEHLEVSGAEVEFGPPIGVRGRPVRLHAEAGELQLTYTAVVPRPDHRAASADPDALLPDPGTLPLALLPWTWPSRYCPSDLVAGTATALFGHRPRCASLLDEVATWVHDHITYVPGVSDALTAADETLLTRQGVCRDLAHVTVSFLRALGIPARVTACYALELDPPDFHLVVEAYDGQEWRLLDPTGLAPVPTLIPIATGRDAAEVAWATAGGGAQLQELSVTVTEQAATSPR
jgi:transglutaminase-like putative cysteine protease